MASVPPWAADPGSLTLTEAQYDSLPDQARKLIEVIDGNVVFCAGGTPGHGDLIQMLANRLDAARPGQPCTRSPPVPTCISSSAGAATARFPSGARISRCTGARTRRQALRAGRAHGH